MSKILKRIIATAAATALTLAVTAALAGCNGMISIENAEKTLYELGLTDYESEAALTADFDKSVTRERAIDAAVRLTGMVMENYATNEDELKRAFLYYSDADEVSEKYYRNVGIGAKKRITDDGNAEAMRPQAAATGEEIKYVFAAALGYSPDKNGADAFYKGVSLPSELKEALKGESVTVKDFLSVSAYVLAGHFENGDTVVEKLIYQLVVDENEAYRRGLAADLFVKRLSVKTKKLSAISTDNINGCLSALYAADEIDDYVKDASFSGGNAASAKKSALSQTAKVRENCGAFFAKEAGAAPAVESKAVTVYGRETVASVLTEKAFSAIDENGVITLENGYYKMTFTAGESLLLTSYYNGEIGADMLTAESEGAFVSIETDDKTYFEKDMELKSYEVKADGLYATLWLAEKNLLLELSVKGDSSPKAIFSLSVKNESGDESHFTPVFPAFRRLEINENVSKQWYLYPQYGGIISNVDKIYNRGAPTLYGGGVTYPIMSLYSEDGGGLYIMPLYQFNVEKFFCFGKKDGAVDMSIAYNERTVKAGEKWEAAKVEVGVHAGDWYNAFSVYKDYLASWFTPITVDTLKGTVNLETAYSSMPSVPKRILSGWTPSLKVEELFKEADLLYGGYDVLHWFDWWNNLGDYQYTMGYGGVAEVREIADITHDNGKLFSLYTESVLANNYSDIALNTGLDIYRRDKNGNLYCNTYYDMVCLDYMLWQDHYVKVLTDMARSVPVNMIYMDQFGIHNETGCYAPGHNHGDVWCGLEGQIELAERLRGEYDAIRKGIAYGGEYPVIDYMSQYVNYVYTYNCCKWYTHHTSGIDLYAFLFPNLRLYALDLYQKGNEVFELIDDLKCTFFNGECRNCLENEAGDYEVVRKYTEIISANEDCFQGSDKTPLLKTDNGEFYVNRFVNAEKSKTIYTFLNRNSKDVKGVILPKPEGEVIYYDLWNNVRLTPVETESGIYLDVTVGTNDVGAVAVIVK